MAKEQKGPKGPRTKREVLDRIITLALDKCNLLGREIRDILLKEFDAKDVPTLRTIQYYMRNAREEAKENIQEQPWSLATMGKAGIPQEAAGFLLEAFDELRRQQERGEKFWHWSAHPLDDVYKGSLEEVAGALSAGREPECISLETEAPKRPFGTVLTNRQAKWLWQIYRIVPSWSLPEWLPELCKRADEYTHREMIAEYLHEEFDTSDLDNDLINLLRNIREKGISSKGEAAN